MIKISRSFNVVPFTNYNVKITSKNQLQKIVHILEDIDFKYSSNSEEFNFDYFNGNLDKITIYCNDQNSQIMINPNAIPIKQIHVSNAIKATFLKDIIDCYKLEEYHDDYAPTLLYGMYSLSDVEILKKNKSLKVIISTGGDVNYTSCNPKSNVKTIKKINTILKIPKIRFISTSSFINKSLSDMKIPYLMVPFMGINFDLYKPVIKGPTIYFYTDGTNKYGTDIYMKLKKVYRKTPFIVTCNKIVYDKLLNKGKLKHGMKAYDKEQLIKEIYPKCFIGLRLTKHDALAASVQELGLLGIKSIHNGCSPSSLNYNTLTDICTHINREMRAVGTMDIELANKVKEYLTIDPKFFNTSYYS